MKMRRGRSGGRVRIGAAVAAMILGGAFLMPVLAGAQTTRPVQSKKLTRELAIMEKIIDQMLLDSQNFLVYSQPETRGLYLEEFGILFSFQASLVNRSDSGFNLNGYEIKDDGDKITVIKPDKNKKKNRGEEEEDEEDEEEDEESAQNETDDETNERLLKTWQKSQENREAKLYRQGKAEILDLLLDYGDTITSLQDDQWLAIAAYLKGSNYFLTNKISRLVLKARAGDVRAFAAGKLSRQAMLARVVEEEY
jgi:hypothetical protein